MKVKRSVRPFFLVAVAALLYGLYTGLGKLGLVGSFGIHHHGFVFINGFLGTIICTERLASHQRSYLMTPVLFIFAGYTLFIAGFGDPGILLVIVAGLITLFDEIIDFGMTKKWKESLLPLLGWAAWIFGNYAYYRVRLYPIGIPFWEFFLLMIILNSRVKQTGNKMLVIYMLPQLLLLITGLFIRYHMFGNILFGMGLVTSAVILLLREFKTCSIPVISAYLWLALSGLAHILVNELTFRFDVVIHTFFIGFVFNMIMGNFPHLIKKVLGSEIQVDRMATIWSLLLTISLLVRIGLGDLLLIADMRWIGGVLNVLVILGFFVSVVARLTTSPRTNSSS